MKKLSLLLLFVVAMSFAGFSQFDEEDGQMLGGSRKSLIPKMNCFNFNDVVDEVVEHQFVIMNSEPGEIKITNISVPKGFGVIVTDDVIESGTDVVFIVSVYKKYLDEGEFVGQVTVETTEEKPTGVVVKKITAYELKGIVK